MKGTGLDEHGDDGLGQSTDSSNPQGGASGPGMEDDTNDDHESEEDIE